MFVYLGLLVLIWAMEGGIRGYIAFAVAAIRTNLGINKSMV